MAARAEQAAALRSEGLLIREIAEQLGISRSYAHTLLDDPDGAKAKARRKKDMCCDCGTAIYSDNPSDSPQLRCKLCQHAYQHASAKWTRETIVAAIRRWVDLYGEAPSASALSAQTVIEREIQRFEDRRQRAEEAAKDAAQQADRLRAALAALTNGKPHS